MCLITMIERIGVKKGLCHYFMQCVLWRDSKLNTLSNGMYNVHTLAIVIK